jgi:hypothetical protein
MCQRLIFVHPCSSIITVMALESYYRLEAWVEDLPRLKFAIVVGIASFIGVFAVSLFFQGANTVHAVMMGVTTVVVYYAFDPR